MTKRIRFFPGALSLLAASIALTSATTAHAQGAPPTYASAQDPGPGLRTPPWAPKDADAGPQKGKPQLRLGAQAGAFVFPYASTPWAVPAAGPSASLTFKTSPTLTMGVRQDAIFASVPFYPDGDGDASLGPEETTCWTAQCHVRDELTVLLATTFVLDIRLAGPVSLEATAGGGALLTKYFPSTLPLPQLGSTLVLDVYKGPNADVRLSGGVSWSLVFLFPHLAFTARV